MKNRFFCGSEHIQKIGYLPLVCGFIMLLLVTLHAQKKCKPILVFHVQKYISFLTCKIH